jgi:putative peptidoglycan lipid II flippase
VVAFFAIGDRLVAGLYQRGAFTDQSTLYVWMILMGYAVGLLPGTLSRLYSSAFYALHDTRTPLRFAVVRVTLAAAAGWLLAFPFRPWVVEFTSGVLRLPLPDLAGEDLVPIDAGVALGAVGLSFASGLASWVELGLLRRAMARRVGSVPVERWYQAKLWGAAIAAGAAGWAVSRLVADLHPILIAALAGGALGGVYLGLAMLLRIPEMGAISRRLKRS